MHDLIGSAMVGSAGRLRGWVEVWTTHMLWLLATLTVSVGAGALVDRRSSNIGKWCAIVRVRSTLGCAASLTAMTRGLYIRLLAAVLDDRTVGRAELAGEGKS